MARFASPEENEDSRLVEFAATRGLPVSALTSYGVHICPDDGEKPGWIALPYYNLTGSWYNRYRNPTSGGEPKYWGKPGSTMHLYNPLRLGPNADTVIFTEGEIDALVLVHLGYPAIGVPGAGGANRFHSSWKLLFEDTKIVVAFDGDEAGHTGAAKIVEAFAPHATELDVPDGMDMNDWYKQDIASLRAALNRLTGAA